MTSHYDPRATANPLLAHDVEDGVLHGSFYASEPPPVPRPKRLGAEDRSASYRVICISMYHADLTALDRMVRELKARGYSKANRSALIRHALSQVELDRVPRGI